MLCQFLLQSKVNQLYIYIYPLFLKFLFIYLFMAVLGLRFCARAFSSCGKRGPLFIAVHGPLTIAASPVAEHRLQTRRLSSCGSRAQLLRGMCDPPRPGLEPVSPALAGRFSTTAPPGKPSTLFQILFPYRSLQSIEQNSLCYTEGPYQLSILDIVVCICHPQSPTLSLTPFPPW